VARQERGRGDGGRSSEKMAAGERVHGVEGWDRVKRGGWKKPTALIRRRFSRPGQSQFEFIGTRAGQDRLRNLRLSRSWIGARARCYGQIFMTPHNCINLIAFKKFICIIYLII
jgi:hypothetical protein